MRSIGSWPRSGVLIHQNIPQFLKVAHNSTFSVVFSCYFLSSCQSRMASPAPMPTSTANWHWKNKNVGAWAKTWFQRELTAITIKGEGEENVTISNVTSVDGDVELGQRKSK